MKRARVALEGSAGVKKVEIDFDSKTATCHVEAEKFDAEKTLKALADANLKNSTVLP